jgi:hypothetical protein
MERGMIVRVLTLVLVGIILLGLGAALLWQRLRGPALVLAPHGGWQFPGRPPNTPEKEPQR